MPNRLSGRTALVTGGANGIGAAIARRLAQEGCAVGILDLDSPRPGRFDESDRAGCERLVAVLLAHHPHWP